MKCFIRYLKYMIDCLRYRRYPLLRDVYKPCSFRTYKQSVETAANLIKMLIRISGSNIHHWNIDTPYIKEDVESSYEFYNIIYPGGKVHENNKTL